MESPSKLVHGQRIGELKAGLGCLKGDAVNEVFVGFMFKVLEL